MHTAEPIEILLILDNEYGNNVHSIRAVFERYGWNITTTALTEVVTSCDYQVDTPLEVDILMPDIEDVTYFDAISVMPGEAHDLIRASSVALNLIRTAAEQSVVVSAWCKGVRVLAAAEVIDGKNVTGDAEYAAEYEAAGATFFELVPPIIDGIIVTGVRSRFYQEEMCEAIATALGVYESDPPVLVSASGTPSIVNLHDDVMIAVNLSDQSGIFSVNCKLFELDDQGVRNSSSYSQICELNSTSEAGLYKGKISDLAVGSYSVDVEAYDIFKNKANISEVITFSVIENGQMALDLLLLTVGAAIGGLCAIIALVVFLRKR